MINVNREEAVILADPVQELIDYADARAGIRTRVIVCAGTGCVASGSSPRSRPAARGTHAGRVAGRLGVATRKGRRSNGERGRGNWFIFPKAVARGSARWGRW